MDKAPGMTSHDVFAIVRRYLNTKKAGHGGTLTSAAKGRLSRDLADLPAGVRRVQRLEASWCSAVFYPARRRTDHIIGEDIFPP